MGEQKQSITYQYSVSIMKALSYTVAQGLFVDIKHIHIRHTRKKTQPLKDRFAVPFVFPNYLYIKYGKGNSCACC